MTLKPQKKLPERTLSALGKALLKLYHTLARKLQCIAGGRVTGVSVCVNGLSLHFITSTLHALFDSTSPPLLNGPMSQRQRNHPDYAFLNQPVPH
jgi:hypothetical protein